MDAVRIATLAAWGLLVAVAIGLEVAGRLRALGLAPVAELLRALRARPVVRGAVVIGWMWLGWHLFAR
jgi:hypothetical protein